MHLQSYVCPSCLASRLGLGNVDHYSITGLLQGGGLDQCVFIQLKFVKTLAHIEVLKVRNSWGSGNTRL